MHKLRENHTNIVQFHLKSSYNTKAFHKDPMMLSKSPVFATKEMVSSNPA